MAVIRDGDLSLDVRYVGFEAGWVSYNICPRWRGEPVLNDKILKRESSYWAARGVGAIRANEDLECGIVPLLRRVLERNEADYWEPLEPDILLALYPNEDFPFLPWKCRIAAVGREQQEASKACPSQDVRHDPHPDDLIEFILCVNVYNFAGAECYTGGSGVCFRLVPSRAELQIFYEELKREYLAFRETWKIQESNEAECGTDYQPPLF